MAASPLLENKQVDYHYSSVGSRHAEGAFVFPVDLYPGRSIKVTYLHTLLRSASPCLAGEKGADGGQKTAKLACRLPVALPEDAAPFLALLPSSVGREPGQGSWACSRARAH